jgi:hypothetical protein
VFLNELAQTLAREAREGGTSILLPVALDDFVSTAGDRQRSAIDKKSWAGLSPISVARTAMRPRSNRPCHAWCAH